MWATIGAGETWYGEIVSHRKNGGLYTEEVTVTPVWSQNGEIENFVAIKHDITARKLAEQALSEAETKYRTIFEDAVIGIFQVDQAGRPVSINRALAQMHGYDTPEEFLSEITDVWHQTFVDPGGMLSVVREAQKNGLVQGVEVEVYCKDRSRRWVIANIRAARGVNGTIELYEARGRYHRAQSRRRARSVPCLLRRADRPAQSYPAWKTAWHDPHTARKGERQKSRSYSSTSIDSRSSNDTLGHSVGDLLLQHVAERLKKWVRARIRSPVSAAMNSC